jgi:hypothetical protein
MQRSALAIGLLLLSVGVCWGQSGLRGDFDNDGRLTARDAEAALQMSAGLREQMLLLDMDGDRNIMSADARIILQSITVESASASATISRSPIAQTTPVATLSPAAKLAELVNKDSTAKNALATPSASPIPGAPKDTPADTSGIGARVTSAGKAAPTPSEGGSAADFAPGAGGAAAVSGSHSATAASGKQSATNPPAGIDTSGFSRTQTLIDAKAAFKVEGDYAEAARLETALRAAEEEARRAAAEWQRYIAAKRAAHEIAEKQRLAYEAQQRLVVQQRAYNEWRARQPVAQQPQPQQPATGQKPTAIIRDPPR